MAGRVGRMLLARCCSSKLGTTSSVGRKLLCSQAELAEEGAAAGRGAAAGAAGDGEQVRVRLREVKSELGAPSPRHDMAMLFTCNICETRSVKTMCKDTYMNGVVIARCAGCNNFHLLADRLGWYGDKGCIEDFMAERGVQVRTATGDDTYQFTVEDLVGKDKAAELAAAIAASPPAEHRSN